MPRDRLHSSCADIRLAPSPPVRLKRTRSGRGEHVARHLGLRRRLARLRDLRGRILARRFDALLAGGRHSLGALLRLGRPLRRLARFPVKGHGKRRRDGDSEPERGKCRIPSTSRLTIEQGNALAIGNSTADSLDVAGSPAIALTCGATRVGFSVSSSAGGAICGSKLVDELCASCSRMVAGPVPDALPSRSS